MRWVGGRKEREFLFSLLEEGRRKWRAQSRRKKELDSKTLSLSSLHFFFLRCFSLELSLSASENKTSALSTSSSLLNSITRGKVAFV